MSDIAYRYISKGGRTVTYGRKEFTDDLIVAASFLIWAEGTHFGGERAEDAYLAMMRLLDMDLIKLRKIVKGEA